MISQGKRYLTRFSPPLAVLISAFFALTTGDAFAQAGTNLALGKPISLSSTLDDGANCVDGNTASGFCSTDMSGTNGIANQWIDVDLGGDFPIEQIRLFNGTDCCETRTRWILVVAGDSSLPRPDTPADVYAQPRYYRFAYANGANGTLGAATSVNGGTGRGALWTTLTIPTGLRKAAWLRIFQLENSTVTEGGLLGFSEIQVIQGNPFQRFLVNQDFEEPVFPCCSNYWARSDTVNGFVPGWSTTDQSNSFEFFVSPIAFSGGQWIELNTFINGTVSQSICVYPGETFDWQLAHRRRVNGGTFTDIAKLSIDGADIAEFTHAFATHSCALLGGAADAMATCTAMDGANGWGAYTGSWTNPNSEPKAVTFEMGAVSSADGRSSFGNFLDAFDVTGLATVVDFTAGDAGDLETVPTASLPLLILNGRLDAPQTLEIALGGTAVRGVHYTTTPETGNLIVTVPAGEYDGTADTAISLAPHLQILPDGPVHSPSDTIVMTLVSLSEGLALGNGATCTLATNPATYEIVDVPPRVDLQKSTSATSATPNGTVVYTITASNTGSVDADGTVISDPIPPGLTDFSWTCSATGGALCPNAIGSGTIDETIATFPPGGSVTYTVTATVSDMPPESVLNTATASLPPGGRCAPDGSSSPCNSTSALSSDPVVQVDKGTPSTFLPPGGTVNYTVTVSNVGSVAAGGTLFEDAIPAGLTAFSWSCTATGGAVCPAAEGTGAISQTIATFPPGSELSYGISATVETFPPDLVTNTAAATPPSGGVCAPDASAPPCTDAVQLAPVPQVNIQKSTTATTVPADGTIPYTVTASNTGSVAADGTVVSDPVPFGITDFTWTCMAAGGAVCPSASGTGAIDETIATFPAGGSVTYTIDGDTGSNPPSLVTNTATATPPADGVCTPGNDVGPCTAAASISPVPIVSLEKSASTETLIPGSTVVFTVVARNVSSVAADGTVISDPVPSGFSAFDWSCSASGGAVCPNASGTGGIDETIATYPSGGELVYTITATVAADPPASVTNTATETPSNNGVCFPGNTEPPCTDAVTLSQPPRVQIEKTSPSTMIEPNGSISYTVTVTNTGVSDADGTLVADQIPPGVTTFDWSCTASGGAVCPNTSGTGAIGETVATFPVGGELVYAIDATVSGSPPAAITNTARATPGNNGVCSPGNTQPPCAESVAVPGVPVVSIDKSTSATVATPGDSLSYSVSVTNVGTVGAAGTLVSDPIPPGLTSFDWTCSASNGALCPNGSGSGAISETLNSFPAGSSVTYTITAVVAQVPPTEIVNVATLTPPESGQCDPSCTDSVTTPTAPLVGIDKSTTAVVLPPLGTVDYTVTVSNPGTVAADGTTLSDPIPTGLTAFDWTCAASGGAVCPNASGTGPIDETIAIFPSGGELIYTITATVSATPPATVINTATVTPPAGGACETSCNASAAVGSSPVLAIAKSTSTAVLNPNGTVTFTVSVRNVGSVAAGGTVVSDPIPPGFDAFDWTCASSGGAVCPNATGTGPISETIVVFPAGSELVYTITATATDNPPASVINTAEAAPPLGGICENSAEPPCRATASIPAAPVVAIGKTTPDMTAPPNGTVTFTVTVSNSGTVPADGTLIEDAIPTGLTAFAWTCQGSLGAVCPAASGSGPINATVATFPVGGAIVHTITATVSGAPPAVIANSAQATPPTGGQCSDGSAPPCFATATVPPVPVVDVSKSAGSAPVAAGGTATFVVVVSNAGAVAANGVVVSDPIPAGMTTPFSWTCATTSGTGACGAASGSGALDTTADLPVSGDAVTYTITGAVAANPPAVITNTATITPPGDGLCNGSCSVETSVDPMTPVVSIQKTTDALSATPGDSLSYTIVASNTGTVAADGTTVSDPVPAGIATFEWVCSAFGGASCPGASGSGAINAVIATFPAGSSVIFDVTATVGSDAGGDIVNTATITPPAGGECDGACTATAAVRAASAAVPTLSLPLLVFLSLLLGALAAGRLRSRTE